MIWRFAVFWQRPKFLNLDMSLVSLVQGLGFAKRNEQEAGLM
jgi:hypothetical protein